MEVFRIFAILFVARFGVKCIADSDEFFVEETGETTLHQYLDVRHENQFNCKEDAPRRTTVGSGLVLSTILVLKPDNNIGDDILGNGKKKISADCTTIEPHGFNVQKTKEARVGIKQQTFRTLRSLTTDKKESISASAAVSYAGVSMGEIFSLVFL